MNTAQRIFKNTLSLLGSGVMAQLLGFILVIYLARVLGPGDFGKINFAMACLACVALAANLGMPLWGTREVAADKSRARGLIPTIVSLRLVLSVGGFLLLVLLALAVNKSAEVKWLIVLFGLGLFPLAIGLDWVFQGLERMEFIGLARLVTAGANLILVLALVRGPDSLLWVPGCALLAALMGAVLLILALRRRYGSVGLRWNWPAAVDILAQAWPLGVSMILIQIIYYADTILLGFMKSDADVGVYNAAYRIVLVVITSGAFYFDAIFPVMSHYHRVDPARLKNLVTHTARLMAGAGVPIGIGGTWLAGPIMNVIYGERYAGSAGVFQIMIWTAVLIFFNMIYARGMWACNQQRAYVGIVAVQAAANIGLNLALIPLWGLRGAAASKVAAELLGLYFYYRQFSRVVRVPLAPYLLKPVLAALVMSGLLYAGIRLQCSVAVLVAAGGLSYLTALFLFRGITKADILLVRSLFARRSPD